MSEYGPDASLTCDEGDMIGSSGGVATVEAAQRRAEHLQIKIQREKLHGGRATACAPEGS